MNGHLYRPTIWYCGNSSEFYLTRVTSDHNEEWSSPNNDEIIGSLFIPRPIWTSSYGEISLILVRVSHVTSQLDNYNHYTMLISSRVLAMTRSRRGQGGSCSTNQRQCNSNAPYSMTRDERKVGEAGHVYHKDTSPNFGVVLMA